MDDVSPPHSFLRDGFSGDPEDMAEASVFQAKLVERFPNLAKHQNYERSSTRYAIVQELNRVFAANDVPRVPGDVSMISRKHFSERLGVSVPAVRWYLDVISDYEELLPYFAVPEQGKFGAGPGIRNVLDDAARCVVEQFPSLERHQHYPCGSTAYRLVTLLNKAIFEGEVERSRNGKFNQTQLAASLGHSKSAMTLYNEIFTDYNQCIGAWTDVFASRIPSMRKWLHNHIASGTLELLDGRVSRQQLFDDLGYRKVWSFDRYPSLGRFWKSADRLVLRIGYRPNALIQRVSLLTEHLSKTPPMMRDGFRINRVQVERDLGWNPNSLRSDAFVAVILAAERDLRKRIEADPLVSIIEGRQYRFDKFLSEGWSHAFLLDVKKKFENFYRTKGTATPAYYSLRDLLEFINTSASAEAVAMREAFQARAPMRFLVKEWERLGLEYRDLGIRSRYAVTHTANSRIATTNSLMRRLGTAGVFPPLTLKLQQFRDDNPSHLLSVAEVAPGLVPKGNNPHVDDYLRFATAMISKAAALREIPITPSEEGSFTQVLRRELEARDYKVTENPAYVILSVIERRLEALKDEAVKIVDQARKLLENGQELLKRAGKALVPWREKVKLKTNAYKAFLAESFPTEGDRREEGLANLLRIIASEFRGRLPVGSKSRGGIRFLQILARRYGGTQLIQSYLLPLSDAVSACLTLYILASGSNISVGRTLEIDCLEPSEQPNSTKITGFKARAAGKPIHVTLADRSAAIRAMRWFDAAIDAVRPKKGTWAKSFFLSLNQNGLEELSEHTYRQRFKEMADSSPELRGLGLTPNMLRPSILLRAALTQDGRTSLSRAIGQHGKVVNQGYSGKYPTRFLHDTTVRHFMHSMETVVVRNVEEIHEALGISVENFEARIEGVMATGLGVLCRDRKGRPGNDGAVCKSLDCWNDCPQLFVVAREKDMAILQIWQASLRAVEGEWMRDRPERWGEVWLPWLCFVDAVELKMRQNYSAIWRGATAIAQSVMSNPHFNLMRLF